MKKFRSTQIYLMSLFRWVRVFWPLAAVLVIGFTVFKEPIQQSIASTPHPQLVYAIFVGALLAAILFGYCLNTYIREHAWFSFMAESSSNVAVAMISARKTNDVLTSVYSVMEKTRGLPLAVRQPAIEQELQAAEVELMARLSLPNLLSGSLVGLGLVGTFIGLLATLSDLSGVFAALGNTGDGDAASMFSTMIVRLQGPMAGMGTAFVASLYGLLGSLIIGIVGGGVRRAAERLLGDVRLFMTNEILASQEVENSFAQGDQSSLGKRGNSISAEGMEKLADNFREYLLETNRCMRDFSTTISSQLITLSDLSSQTHTELLKLNKNLDHLSKQTNEVAEKNLFFSENLILRLDATEKVLMGRIRLLSRYINRTSWSNTRGLGGEFWTLAVWMVFVLIALSLGALLWGGWYHSSRLSFSQDQGYQQSDPDLVQPRQHGASNAESVSIPSPPASSNFIDEIPLKSNKPVDLNSDGGLVDGLASHDLAKAVPLVSTWRVRSGETLSHIARRFGVTVEMMRIANPGLKSSDHLSIDQELLVPATDGLQNR